MHRGSDHRGRGLALIGQRDVQQRGGGPVGVQVRSHRRGVHFVGVHRHPVRAPHLHLRQRWLK